MAQWGGSLYVDVQGQITWKDTRRMPNDAVVTMWTVEVREGAQVCPIPVYIGRESVALMAGHCEEGDHVRVEGWLRIYREDERRPGGVLYWLDARIITVSDPESGEIRRYHCAGPQRESFDDIWPSDIIGE
jgi:hypothetical protein